MDDYTCENNWAINCGDKSTTNFIKEGSMKTKKQDGAVYCIECVHVYEGNKYYCRSGHTKVTDFIGGLTECEKVNYDGLCPQYQPNRRET